MKLYIFSDAKNISSLFSKIDKSPKHIVSYHPTKDAKKQLATAEKNSFVYYDFNNLKTANQAKILKLLTAKKGPGFGIIDLKGTVNDIAELFHRGARDYLGKNISKTGFTEKRLTAALDFLKTDHSPEKIADAAQQNFILSGSNWATIIQGKEYTFCMMFIEIDNQGELKKQFNSKQLGLITRRFHDYIESQAETTDGKIWMWMDLGGLLLFPFDGKRCEALLTGIRLILDKNIISAEDIGFSTSLTYRVALHIGNTLYQKRGNTGAIVSDSINSIFHLGQKFAEPGGLYLTETVFPFIPQGLKPYFADAGNYENRTIQRLKKLLPPECFIC